jgi:hypothetical protein
MPFKRTAVYSPVVAPRVVVGLLTLALSAMGSSCGGGPDRVTPVAPSSGVPAGPPPATPRPDETPGELWSLTTTIVSLEGSACFWSQPAGKTFTWTLSVLRDGGDVHFVYDVNNPHDNLSFTGTVHERSFTAVSGTSRSQWACAGHVEISSSVAGSFSPDGGSLTGRERLMYRADGGELAVNMDWRATRN